MFEYALGRRLSYRNNADLKFDIRSYKTNLLGNCSFWLEGFHIDIQDNLATPWELLKFKIHQKRYGRKWALYNYLFADELKYIEEHSFKFNKHALESKDNVYLDGWWQNEKYFIDIRNILLKDFMVRHPLEGKNKEVAKEIVGSNSIGIHIRRLDYVTNQKTKEYHGELTKEYYDKALSIITQSVPNPTLFIFSDDIRWVTENMSFPFNTVHIGWNLESPHEDMRLMSLCKHFITANSSFGWWGAWLGVDSKKIVVAPEKWTNDKRDTNERVPESWIKI